MAAIADSDDLYAWLIRGFVESGLPDHTRGDRPWIASGALNLDNFSQDRGVAGILLEFLGQVGGAPVPEDHYTYAVCVERDAEGTRVVVRSEDTLFHHSFPWGGGRAPRNAPPATDGLTLAAHILGEVRAHNERFTEWRAQGGVTTVSQRRGIPAAQGVPADRALLAVFETLRRSGRSMSEGPANKWWVKAAPAGGPVRIEAGLGQEPVYVTRKNAVVLSPEDIAHAARLRTAGTLLLVSAGISVAFLLAGTAYSGLGLYRAGLSGFLAQGWTVVASVLGSLVFAGVHGFAGWRLRVLRSKMLVAVLAGIGMLPCLAPCCAVGFPAGAWVLYLLRDERTNKVFTG